MGRNDELAGVWPEMSTYEFGMFALCLKQEIYMM